MLAAYLRVRMFHAERHIFERGPVAISVGASFLPGTAMKTLHKFEAERRVIELFPMERVANFYGLRASC